MVWFKRDLRVRDHQPLHTASIAGPVLSLYCVEPSLLRAPDFSSRHWNFIAPALRELARNLDRAGAPLIIFHGEVLDALAQLHSQAPFVLHSHAETGAQITFGRDRAVARWARENQIEWKEYPSGGVVRGLRDRNGWAKEWERRISRELLPIPRLCRPSPLPRLTPTLDQLPSSKHLGLDSETDLLTDLPTGESGAHFLLESFLDHRGARYQREMSSPLTAFESCSRLSPHFAWGTLSLREAAQRARQRVGELRQTDFRLPHGERFLRGSLSSFDARLHWHCHFIQKLETEPAIEHHCFIRAFDDLRADGNDPERLAKWQTGTTGYPFIDACMRALRHHGWINFRMRSMLVSFAAYDLWLDWRIFRDWLARQFIDYEPGIHFSQLQMQSGTTGINTLRIYSPLKQSLDQDPKGAFISRWVPELADLPAPLLHEPWKASQKIDYPPPVVEHTSAIREARARISTFRKEHQLWEAAREVAQKHGSRRSGMRQRGEPPKLPSKKRAQEGGQLTLFE
ncbi:MAG: FAD-binding domain-containing protein [Puniceicoccaceae bacterium]